MVAAGGRDGGSRTEEADLVVDASGRAARVARLIGVRRVRYDRLVAWWRTDRGAFHLRPTDRRPIDSTTLVEAVPDGWWYSMFLPGHRLVVAFMTDADLLVAPGPAADGLRALLDEAPATRTRVDRRVDGRSADPTRPHRTATRSSVRTGWRSATPRPYDPLASYGIAAALGQGFYAAAAVAEHLAGDPTPCSLRRLSTHLRSVPRAA